MCECVRVFARARGYQELKSYLSSEITPYLNQGKGVTQGLDTALTPPPAKQKQRKSMGHGGQGLVRAGQRALPPAGSPAFSKRPLLCRGVLQ